MYKELPFLSYFGDLGEGLLILYNLIMSVVFVISLVILWWKGNFDKDIATLIWSGWGMYWNFWASLAVRFTFKNRENAWNRKGTESGLVYM